MAQKLNNWTRIKRRAAEVLVTPPTALTLSAELLLSDNRRGVQAVSKPMASVYGTRLRRAGTNVGRSVAISTVLVVA